MEPFIKKQDYNYINRCLKDLNNAFQNCSDRHTVEMTKGYIQDKILNHFYGLSDQQKALLEIRHIKDSTEITNVSNHLLNYVYGMPTISNGELKKLFKKEKKLNLPDTSIQDEIHVYLGWIDYATQKLFIVHQMDGQFLGMSCQIPKVTTKQTNVCTLCHHIGPKSEVAFVSPVYKRKEAYHSLGFYMCLDSQACNERIVSTEKLETILKTVNNIK